MKWFLAGLIVGWITKVPFLIKWYREFEADKQHRKSIVEKFNRMYPKDET